MKNWMKFVFYALFITAGCSESIYTLNENVDLSSYKTFAWIEKDSSRITNYLYDNEIIGNEIIDDVSNELIARGFTVELDSPDVLLQYTITVENKEQIINTPGITNIPPAGGPYITPYSPYYPSSAYNASSYYNNTNAPYDSPYSLYYYHNSNNYYTPGYYANNYPYYTPYGFPFGRTTYTNSIQQINFKEGTLIIDLIDRKTKKLLWRGWSTEALSDPENYKKNLPIEIRGIFKRLPTETNKGKK